MGIQVVGRACRLPGANSVTEFWDLLHGGRCSVTAIPRDRFSQDWYQNPRKGEPGKAYTFAAGVIDDVWGFDPAVFAITPREARQMDPQQRLVLQLAWEALEDAGVSPFNLGGRRIGVYMGASSMDHSHRQYFDPAGTDSYLMTGNTLSLISNRVSYIFDLIGPSLTFDTACSSSLVALDYAIQDLREGRADAAIVGGVNALLSPFNFMGFCAASMLSPDGLCRPFDHRANGYVRSEGGVVMVLQRDDNPLSNRTAHGEIVASAMNSDGRTSGVALPSSDQQAALLKQVYAQAGIDPNKLAFVEAHGTGTLVGDPAEANAIGEALGTCRRVPLPIGSAKSNIGHLEPASGLVGLLKAQLALEHRVYPSTLHVEMLNPYIDFHRLNLSVAVKPIALPSEKTLLAGVNNFGFGGTNVHVVIRRPHGKKLKSAKSRPLPHHPDNSSSILMLAAQCSNALRALAQRYESLLNATATNASDLHHKELASAVAHRRTLLRERVATVADTDEAMQQGLTSFVRGDAHPTVISGSAVGRNVKTALIFSGNGAQWDGMGRTAHKTSPDFRRHFRLVDRHYYELTGTRLETLLFADNLADLLRRTEVAQPLLFAIQVALANSLLDQGLKPQAVVGHSVGEVAAAHIAGALDLEQAVQVIYARSSSQELVRGMGRMAAINLSANDTQHLIDENHLSVSLAAINSPRSVTVAGKKDTIQTFLECARRHQAAGRLLEIDYPFHSAELDPVKEPLLASLAGLKPSRARYTIFSTVTGKACAGEEMGATYWWHNVREPVQFSEAVSAAANTGCQVFIEIGPRTVLRNYLADILEQSDAETSVISTFDCNDAAEIDPVRIALARALVAGADHGLEQTFGPNPVRDITLPSYPWQNTEYRLSPSPEALETISPSQEYHALLGMQLRPEDLLWESQLDTVAVPFLADHKVGTKAILPGSAYIEMALAAARHALKTDRVELRDVDFTQALELSPDRCKDVRTRLDADSGTIAISSRTRLSGDDYQTNVRARYGRAPSNSSPLLSAPAACEDTTIDAKVYRMAEAFSLNYGPAFKKVTACREVGDSIVEVVLLGEENSHGLERFTLHPVDFDACFHGLNVIFERLVFGENKLSYVPVRIGTLRIYQPGKRLRTARIRLSSYSTRAAAATLEMFSADGTLVAIADDVRFRAANIVQRPRLNNSAYHIAATYRPLRDGHHRSLAPPVSKLQAALSQRTARLPALTFDKQRENRLLIELAAKRTALDVVVSLPELESGPQLMGAASDPLSTWLAQINSDSIDQTSQPDHKVQLPTISEILSEVLTSDPAWSADCVLLLKAAKELSTRLSNKSATAPLNESSGAETCYSSSTLDHFYTSSPRAHGGIEAVVEAFATAISHWPAQRPLKVLQLGANSGLTRALTAFLDHPGRNLVVADTDARKIGRFASQWQHVSNVAAIAIDQDGTALQQHGLFDIIVSAYGLHRLDAIDEALAGSALASKDGAIAIIAEAERDCFYDMVFGIESDWFQSNLDGQVEGRLRPADDWILTFAKAGFAASEVSEEKAQIPGGFLLLAERVANARPQIIEHTTTNELHPSSQIILLAEPNEARSHINTLAASLSAELNVSLDIITPSDFSSDRGLTLKSGEQFFELPPTIIFASAPLAPDEAADHAGALHKRICELTLLLQTIGQTTARLWILAEGGARDIANLGDPCPVQTGVWSYCRTAMNEFSHVDLRLVDFAGDMVPDAFAEAISRLLSDPGDLHEFILSNDTVCGLTVKRGLPSFEPSNNSTPTPHDQLTVLNLDQLGNLDDLRWINRGRRPPRDDEIEIAVAATGLNFRDVMWSLGLLPEEALEDGFAGPTLGFECSGTVARVGKHVLDFKPGDRVMAMAPACFASHVTVTADAAMHIPAEIPLVDAATLPVAFLTAYYALDHLAQIKPGEWVLIHGAAGGVGLAAVQVAKHRGAKIIATAGSDEKRTLLSFLGANHVLDTRSLEFCDHVRAITRDGVDVVLNSLAGEAMERSLELLRPFGRFLELGKRDFYANTKLGLRPLRRNVAYFGVDADQLFTYRPAITKSIFEELVAAFNDGAFRALPYRLFDSGSIGDAFRLMQKSGHIGKILVTAPAAGSGIDHVLQEFKVTDDGTHIIFGGTGGFGLEMCRWLADRGAKRIVIASRSGGSGERLDLVRDELAEREVELSVEHCDVSDERAVERLLQEIRGKSHIAGITLTAMVLDDALIRDLTPSRIGTVLNPKVRGAELLDRHCEEDELDYFILFSSAAAMFGNPGQASYVAANGYLDGLARTRRSRGKPALSVAWGAITDVGVLARQKETAESLSRHTGGIAFTARDGLGFLAQILANPTAAAFPNITLAAMNWSTAAKALPIMATPTYSAIRREIGTSGASDIHPLDIRAAIQGIDDADARAIIAGHLANEAAQIFRMPVEDISPKRALSELGMDSLMGLELVMGAERRLGIQLPLTSFSQGASLNDIAGQLLAKLRVSQNGDPNDDIAERTAMLSKHVEDDVDPSTLDAIAELVERRERGLENVI